VLSLGIHHSISADVEPSTEPVWGDMQFSEHFTCTVSTFTAIDGPLMVTIGRVKVMVCKQGNKLGAFVSLTQSNASRT
jgi:hypothetical protein